MECTLPFRDRIPTILKVLLVFDLVVFFFHLHLVYTTFGRFLRTIMSWGNFEFLSATGVARLYVIFFIFFTTIYHADTYIKPFLENWLFLVSLVYHNHDRFCAYTVLRAICSQSAWLLREPAETDSAWYSQLETRGVSQSMYDECKNMRVLKAEIIAKPFVMLKMKRVLEKWLDLNSQGTKRLWRNLQ